MPPLWPWTPSHSMIQRPATHAVSHHSFQVLGLPGRPAGVRLCLTDRLWLYLNTDTGNWARYLVDCNDAKATFDFCGGMMFQLVLSDKLRSRL